MFEDMGRGGLSKYISRMDGPSIGGFELLRTFAADAVLAAKNASPGSQVTIGFIAAVLEQAEYEAEQLGISLQVRLGNETIGGIADQYNKSAHTNWLTSMTSSEVTTVISQPSERSQNRPVILSSPMDLD